MRVAFEVDYAGAGDRGGTHAIRHLLDLFGKLAPQDEFLVFGWFFHDFKDKIKQIHFPDSPNVRPDVRRWPQALVKKLEWDMGFPIIERHLARAKVDVYDCFRAPARGYKKLVMRGADGTHVKHPDWHPGYPQYDPKILWDGFIKPGLLKADVIIAYCKTQRDDLVELLGVPEDRFAITYPGVDLAAFRPDLPKEMLEAHRAAYRLPGRYLAMIGPFDVVMNYDAVFAALAHYKGKTGEKPPVVAVGPVAGYGEELQKRAARAGVGDQFVWVGQMPHARLAPTLAMADGLLYPTLYSGIEMPPLEAMACGVSVLTSRNEAVDEKAECAVVVDPRSPEDIAAGIAKIWESSELRARLRERGPARARSFTWEAMARGTLDVYRRLA